MSRSNMLNMVRRLVKRESPGDKDVRVIVRIRLQPKEVVALGHYLALKDVDLNKYIQAILLDVVRKHMRDRENRKAVEEIYRNIEEKGHLKLRSAKIEASKKTREDQAVPEAHSEQKQDAWSSADRPSVSDHLDLIDHLPGSDHLKPEVESRELTPLERQRETLGKYAAQMGLIDPKEDEGTGEKIEGDRDWIYGPARKQPHAWPQAQTQTQTQTQRRDASYVPRSDEIANMLNPDSMDVVREVVRKAKLLSRDLDEQKGEDEPR